MPKPKSKSIKLLGKNSTDPMVLARSIVEAAIGETFAIKKEGTHKKKPSVRGKIPR
jgi:hypothetical protein